MCVECLVIMRVGWALERLAKDDGTRNEIQTLTLLIILHFLRSNNVQCVQYVQTDECNQAHQTIILLMYSNAWSQR